MSNFWYDTFWDWIYLFDLTLTWLPYLVVKVVVFRTLRKICYDIKWIIVRYVYKKWGVNLWSISSISSIDEPQDRTYLAAKEIYTTEKTFNQILHLLYVDFREHIMELKIVPDAEFEKIFSNIVQIRLFSDALLKELEERIQAWDVETSKIADILVRVGPFIK